MAVRLAVVLDSLALLQGVTAIIEERGVMLLLATDVDVTSVVGVIWLKSR